MKRGIISLLALFTAATPRAETEQPAVKTGSEAATTVHKTTAENCEPDGLSCIVSDSEDVMVIQAPVPVPVRGNTYYDQSDIDRLPTRNGNISDLLKTNPAVRFNAANDSSLNQGSIRPQDMSFHGASPYQNSFMIDGVSATNNLNPANNSTSSNPTNISSMSQGYFLDISLLDSVRVYDSNVPIEYGRFSGGVVDARLRRFSGDDSLKLNYRTSRSEWVTTHIDDNQRRDFENGGTTNGGNFYSPHFRKNFYTVSVDKALSDTLGFTAGLSHRQSEVTRAEYATSTVSRGTTKHENVIDTLLFKGSWLASDQETHDVNVKFNRAYNEYNTSMWPESDREMGSQAWGLGWDYERHLALGKLKLTAGWDRMQDYTRHDGTILATENNCTYPGITGQCTRGGLGHITQELDNLTAKARWDFRRFNIGEVNHDFYLGGEYTRTHAQTQRHNRSEAYKIDTTTGVISNHTIYMPGKGSLDIDEVSLYLADSISWKTLTLVPGIRYDYDSYLDNSNISPRMRAEWDVFGNHETILSSGFGRYYGGNVLNLGLQDIRNGWRVTGSGQYTQTYYQDLATPYNDEWTLGLQQRAGNVILGANYVNRQAKDQINRSKKTVSSTLVEEIYTNEGRSKTHSFNLSLGLVEPLRYGKLDVNPQLVFSRIKTKGNLSLESGYDDTLVGTNGDKVVYNGQLVDADSVPVKDFNTPWTLSANLDFTLPEYGVLWANTVSYQKGREARIALIRTDADYISSLSDYYQYRDTQVDSSVTWDMRFSYQPQFIKNQSLTVSVDVLNVLDAAYVVDSARSGSQFVSRYGSGRQLWLDVSYTF